VLAPDPAILKTYPPRYRYAGVAAAVLVAALIFSITSLPTPYAVAFGIWTGTMITLVEIYWADQRITRIEAQLADAIDLMVASLRAGSALMSALEITSRESQHPMRDELEAMVGRIRLGEDPGRGA